MNKGISSYLFSFPISMLAGRLKNVPGQVAVTWDAPAESMQNLYKTASL